MQVSKYKKIGIYECDKKHICGAGIDSTLFEFLRDEE